jgi:Sel1 repeat
LERRKCLYIKYLCLKNQLLNRRINCYQDARHRQFSSCVTKIANCHQSTSASTQKVDDSSKKTPSDEDQAFNFSGLSIFEKRFQTFVHDEDVKQGNHKTYFNVNNEKTKEKTLKKERNDDVPKDEPQRSSEKFKEEVFANVSQMIGEVEFQMGIDCIKHNEFKEAAEHFKMSTNTNNASACFNLALLYEKGLGVEKDLMMAKKLYQMASDWGSERALYNLGVYFAQGLGGAKKSTRQAKLCFERAARMGDANAIEAINMLKPSLRRKVSSEPEDFIEHDHECVDKSPVLLKSVNYYSNPRQAMPVN